MTHRTYYCGQTLAYEMLAGFYYHRMIKIWLDMWENMAVDVCETWRDILLPPYIR